MAIYNLPNYKAANGFDMPLNMNRANPDPLDNSSVWATYADALNYAKTSPVAYVGQIVTVVNYTEAVIEDDVITTPATATVDVYKIELDANGVGTLVKIGSSDEVADLDTEVKQIITRVSNTESAVSTLEGKVDTIETDLGTAKNDIDKAEESIAANIQAIDAVEADVEQLKKDVDAVEELASNNKTRLDQYDTDKANYASKDEVRTAKSEAVAAAKTETENQISAVVSQYLTGEGAADTIDTLQEIVNWLNTEGAGADKIVADVETIKNDYLKGSDKTELNQAITNLSNYVGTLPERATSTTVVAYIQEVVDALKIGDYAKATDLTALAERVTTLEGKVKTLEETTIPGIGTEISGISTRLDNLEKIDHHNHTNLEVLAGITSDKVEAWDDAVAKKHEHTNKSILDTITETEIAKWNDVSNKANSSDLTQLTTRVGNAETAITKTLPEEISKKVTQTYTEVDGNQVANRLITPSEAQKLDKLILNEDGSVTTGQSVAAGDVQGLADWITNNGPTHIKNLTKNNLSDELVTQISSAITNVYVNGTPLVKTDGDGSVHIPLATVSEYGIVKLGSEFDRDENSGALQIAGVSVSKLTQASGEILELNGGNSAGGFDA